MVTLSRRGFRTTAGLQSTATMSDAGTSGRESLSSSRGRSSLSEIGSLRGPSSSTAIGRGNTSPRALKIALAVVVSLIVLLAAYVVQRDLLPTPSRNEYPTVFSETFVIGEVGNCSSPISLDLCSRLYFDVPGPPNTVWVTLLNISLNRSWSGVSFTVGSNLSANTLYYGGDVNGASNRTQLASGLLGAGGGVVSVVEQAHCQTAFSETCIPRVQAEVVLQNLGYYGRF